MNYNAAPIKCKDCKMNSEGRCTKFDFSVGTEDDNAWCKSGVKKSD